jgi:hypothetical protein
MIMNSPLILVVEIPLVDLGPILDDEDREAAVKSVQN